jgi:hypothetical protein
MLTCTILKSSGSRPRQPVDARSRCTLRGLSSLRGTPRAGTAGVPLCSQARQLVEHGRDHNRRALRPMPQLSDRRHRLGSEILAWQRQRMPHAPASNRYSQSTRLAQKWAAPIPANPISGAPNLKSHNHSRAGRRYPHDAPVARRYRRGRDWLRRLRFSKPGRPPPSKPISLSVAT